MKIRSAKLYCFCIGLITMTCMPVHASEYPKVAFSGTAMLDYDSFEGNFLERSDEDDDALELRRFRLRFKADLSEHWRAKISLDVSDGSEIKDAYVQYSKWDFANITLGRQKEPFGLEWLSGSKDLASIERSISTSAIAPSRAFGISLQGNEGKLNWQLGYFQDDNTQRSNATTGRLSWAPWYTKKNLVHVGVAFSERNIKADEFRINERLEIHGADSLFEGERFDAEQASLLGLEFAWQFNGLLATSEWQQSKVQAVDGNEYLYEGAYYQLSYLLSGKNRKYKQGVFDGVNSQNDWEVFIKQSYLNMEEENSKAQIFTAGVNYYANKNLKLMANLVRAQNTQASIDIETGNAIALRLQYKF